MAKEYSITIENYCLRLLRKDYSGLILLFMVNRSLDWDLYS